MGKKAWEDPKILELDVDKTEYGDDSSNNIDAINFNCRPHHHHPHCPSGS